MIDWENLLGATLKGLVVEGSRDQKVIEKFLDAGENVGHWSNWRSKIFIRDAGGIKDVFKEMTSPFAQTTQRIWGLIDRDWRSSNEINRLRTEYNQFIVLPRIHIENYFIIPDELELILPASTKAPFSSFKHNIESQLEDFLRHGAMSWTLAESGLEDFCHEGGYKLVRKIPMLTDVEIQNHLTHIHQQVEPKKVFGDFQNEFNRLQSSSALYQEGLHGKDFFQQIVVNALNRYYQAQNSADIWIENIGKRFADCPADLIPLLQPMVK